MDAAKAMKTENILTEDQARDFESEVQDTDQYQGDRWEAGREGAGINDSLRMGSGR